MLVTAVSAVHIHWYGAELSVADTFLCNDRLRKPYYGSSGPAKYHAFDAVVVVQMGMQRRHRDVVVLMLFRRKPTR